MRIIYLRFDLLRLTRYKTSEVNKLFRFCVEEENEIALNVGDRVEIHTHYQAKYNLGMSSFMLKCPKWHAKENFNDGVCKKNRK